MNQLPELVRRQLATQRTLDRFRGRAFDWKTGMTCVHLVRFHLRSLGHRPPKLPPIASLLGARRALAARGWADCAAMLDARRRLKQIPAAAMLLGDLAFRESEDGIGGILICGGPHKLMGWFENAPGMVVMDMSFDQVGSCWRV